MDHPGTIEDNLAMKRCGWAGTELLIAYHDSEWGLSEHDDRSLFEFLILEGAQAGLSWETVLRKRDNYRKAFDNFDANLIAAYDHIKVDELLGNPGIIRNRSKIQAAIINAKAFLLVQEEFGSFDAYIWRFVNGQPMKNKWEIPDVPTRTAESEAMSQDLKRRGLKFVGATICYAFMQAVGMVNDHEKDCFRYEEIG
jgi:DNA-3-methyladenine glycosylase I